MKRSRNWSSSDAVGPAYTSSSRPESQIAPAIIAHQRPENFSIARERTNHALRLHVVFVTTRLRSAFQLMGHRVRARILRKVTFVQRRPPAPTIGRLDPRKSIRPNILRPCSAGLQIGHACPPTG